MQATPMPILKGGGWGVEAGHNMHTTYGLVSISGLYWMLLDRHIMYEKVLFL